MRGFVLGALAAGATGYRALVDPVDLSRHQLALKSRAVTERRLWLRRERQRERRNEV